MTIEKRKSPRIDMRLPAWYRISEAPESLYQATVLNLAADGICFVSKLRLMPGAEIELKVTLNQQQTVTIKTRVMWAAEAESAMGFKAGVQIIDATRDDEERFIKFYCHQVLIAPRSGQKILVIDDEKDMVELLRIELEHENYAVVCAYDGLEGYEKFLREKPDLIILDLKLPKLNGYAVCRKIRREVKDVTTPIMMLTAKNEDVDRIVGRVIGAEKYVTKPFETDKLLTEIRTLLQPVF